MGYTSKLETLKVTILVLKHEMIDMQMDIGIDMDKYSYSLFYNPISYALKHPDILRHLPVSSS